MDESFSIRRNGHGMINVGDLCKNKRNTGKYIGWGLFSSVITNIGLWNKKHKLDSIIYVV